ncbi:MAG: thioesterase [Flaviaesturariibacter sp.]|nr:thioesterase [Flaviaesturariibacter sp.]
MPRIKIALPEIFPFFTQLTVRVTDLNYGGHLGNDALLSLIHEARMQFLRHHGLSELEFAGVGLIMSDVGIEFKAEAFFGDIITAFVAAGDFSRVGFDLYYKLVKGEAQTPVAFAKTGMVCYDYTAKKVAIVPEQAAQKLIGQLS